MEENIVYHGSSKPGLKRLEPFECKHGKPYVYATKDYITVLFFAAKGQGMFDGFLKEDENGIPTFYETYPTAFHSRYYGKSSYCYILKADTFTNATEDPCEVVSEVPVDVIGVRKIDDIGKEWEKLIKEKKFRFAPYNTTDRNSIEECEKFILNQFITRGYFEGKDFRQRKWAEEYFKDLLDKYRRNKNK